MQKALFIKCSKVNNEQEDSQLTRTLELHFDEEDRWLVALNDDDEKYEQFILFWESHKCQQMINLVESFDLLVESKDLSRIILTDVLPESIRTIFKDDPNFEDLIAKFIEQNATIDDVLDKISNIGIQSLSEFEKALLEKG